MIVKLTLGQKLKKVALYVAGFIAVTAITVLGSYLLRWVVEKYGPKLSDLLETFGYTYKDGKIKKAKVYHMDLSHEPEEVGSSGT